LPNPPSPHAYWHRSSFGQICHLLAKNIRFKSITSIGQCPYSTLATTDIPPGATWRTRLQQLNDIGLSNSATELATWTNHCGAAARQQQKVNE